MSEGWAYLADATRLTGLLAFSAVVSLSAGSFNALFCRWSSSTESTVVLGGLASIGGWESGGGLILTAWGGPQRRIVGVNRHDVTVRRRLDGDRLAASWLC